MGLYSGGGGGLIHVCNLGCQYFGGPINGGIVFGMYNKYLLFCIEMSSLRKLSKGTKSTFVTKQHKVWFHRCT